MPWLTGLMTSIEPPRASDPVAQPDQTRSLLWFCPADAVITDAQP